MPSRPGIRVVREREQLADAVRMCSSEAEASFGDGKVFIERYIQQPRHVEVQVLADCAGNVVRRSFCSVLFL